MYVRVSPPVLRALVPAVLIAATGLQVLPAVGATEVPQRSGVASSATASVSGIGSAVRPTAPVVRDYPVSGVSRSGLELLGGRQSTAPYAALSRVLPASGFAVVGATWRGPAPEGLDLAVRTVSDGAWSAWTSLDFDDEHGPDPESAEARGSIPGTDPYVVGEVDGVQLAASTSSGLAPRLLSLSVVDPGPTLPDRHASEPVAPAADRALVAGAAPMPTIHTRADWGADESLRGCCVEYGTIHAGFVHHTVNSNDYTRDEVPAIIRGIYAYHTQTRGWRDIGYNFLIDRFGGIWEGRYGGVANPIVGAHTLYYNEYSFAASAIGNFDLVQPSSQMLDSYARLYAWKLGLTGIKPSSRQVVGSTMFDAISGHRDAAATACPGQHLYTKIPQIIRAATSYQTSGQGSSRPLSHSFVDTKRPDVLLVRNRTGAVSVARGTGPGGFGRVSTAYADFTGHSQVSAVGDVTGDGRNDVTARDTTTERTTIYRGHDDGTFTRTKQSSTATWSRTNLFAGVGDVTSDGLADIMARNRTSGALKLYPAKHSGGFGAARTAIRRFAGMDRLAAAGDFDGDGHRDLLSRSTQGVLSVWFGDGAGRFPRRSVLAEDWSGVGLLSGGADLTGDGRPDVVARSSTSKVLRVYANVAGQALSPAVGHGLDLPMTSLSLSGDLTGDHEPDLLVMTPAGALEVVTGHRRNWTTPPHTTPTAWRGMDRVLVVGDWDRDGDVDAMARSRNSGALWLFPGRERGGFAARKTKWEGWGDKSMLTAVGDLDGDRYPDLMARAADGKVYLYPGRDGDGFRHRVLMTTRLAVGSQPIAVGDWDGDGSSDVLVRKPSGRMTLRAGDGAGALARAVDLGDGFARYRTVLGVGDMTGKGGPDLVGRDEDGRVFLIPGLVPSGQHPNGGFGPRQYLGSGWNGFLMG